MKSIKMLTGLTTLVLSAACASSALASERSDSSPPLQNLEASENAKPIKGKVEAIDKEANTLTVGETQYSITGDTKFHRQGKEIALADVKVGDEVRGVARQGEGGKLVATMVTVLPAKS